MTPELEDTLGPRIDKAVDKVGGLLPVEWSQELRAAMREIVADAHAAGAAQGRCVEADLRSIF